MCGIAGAIGVVDDRVRAALHRIDEAQLHRGPDGHGWWSRHTQASAASVAFAHRRLSILDLDARSAQPMIDPVSGNVITFNGEIYNYRELRTELEADGFAFRTTSDTEVVLAAWTRWGEESLTRLAGMFAFALYEAKTGDVVLARDRIGIKPLYYADSRAGGALDGSGRTGGARDDGTSTLYFASEVRALLASGAFERAIDPTALATFAWHGFVCGAGTIVRGIRSLPPGTWARVHPSSPIVEPRVFWSPPRPPRREYALDVFEFVLERAVRQHLASDVPLAVFLSGGVDSSAVANLASRAQPGLKTFNVAFDEAAFDESHSARAIAAALGTDHHEVRLSADVFARDLPRALASLDQPTFDGINTWFVSRAVRDAGVVVALAGTGGDELFGGYTSFRDLPRVRRASRALSMVPRAVLSGATRSTRSGRNRSKHGVPPQTRWGKLGDALETRGCIVQLYQTAYSLFTNEFRAELLAPSLAGLTQKGLAPERLHELCTMTSDRGELEAISVLEIASFLSERLLRDTDAVSMDNSIEVRVPLLDHRVIEAAMNLKESVRYEALGSKLPLRQVGLAGLDPALFERPKSGFVLPIERWCRTTLAADVEAVLSDREACRSVGLQGDAALRLWQSFRDGDKGIYWSRVWALYVLVRWSHDHGVRL